MGAKIPVYYRSEREHASPDLITVSAFCLFCPTFLTAYQLELAHHNTVLMLLTGVVNSNIQYIALDQQC